MPKPGSRKLSKEEKEKLKALEQERKQREAEEARLIAIEEEVKEKVRQEAELIAKEESKKLLLIERQKQLLQTQEVIKKVNDDMIAINEVIKGDEEWERLMRCDGLPDPKSVPECNRYLSLWKADATTSTLEGCIQKTPQVIHVISELEAVIEETTDATEKQQVHWREIWLALQDAQREKLNEATYGQLLDLRPYLDHETMVYSFIKSSKLVSLALWCNTNRSQKNNLHKIDELGFSFQLPSDLVDKECVVRVMRTEYDHYSKFARTFHPPNVKEEMEDILAYVESEEELAESAQQAIVIPEEEQKELLKEKDEELERPASPKKAPPPHMTDTAPGELNLRRFRVQGGIFTLDLVEIPPQPRVVAECTITQVEDEQTVVNIPWEATYNPPRPPDAADQRRRDPEEVEQEMRLLEKELQKLVLITIKLPDSAFWFEPPHMVLWDPKRNFWCTDCFQDIKYNEDTCTLQVRATRLGVMGLAMNRFANLPYQNWELTPKGTNSASLTLYGSVVVAEFTIAEGQVCVTSLQDGNKKALTELYGTLMKPKVLMQILRSYGINMFPDRDSYCYMDGLPVKHLPTEAHLYATMALLSSSLAFQWSRWNLLAGENKIVFQMKTKNAVIEEGVGQPLVLVTPQLAAIVECTELSQTFSEMPRGDMEYYADLYQLAIQFFGEEVQEVTSETSSHFVNTVFNILQSASCLSYC